MRHLTAPGTAHCRGPGTTPKGQLPWQRCRPRVRPTDVASQLYAGSSASHLAPATPLHQASRRSPTPAQDAPAPRRAQHALPQPQRRPPAWPCTRAGRQLRLTQRLLDRCHALETPPSLRISSRGAATTVAGNRRGGSRDPERLGAPWRATPATATATQGRRGAGATTATSTSPLSGPQPSGCRPPPIGGAPVAAAGAAGCRRPASRPHRISPPANFLPLPTADRTPPPRIPALSRCRAQMMDSQPATPSKSKPGRRPCSLTTLLLLFALVAGAWRALDRDAAGRQGNGVCPGTPPPPPHERPCPRPPCAAGTYRTVAIRCRRACQHG